MGLLGLRKFIDSSGCIRLLPVPLSDHELQEQEERRQRCGIQYEGDSYNHMDGSDDRQERAASSSTHPPLVDHVLVDMNCIVHSCFGKHDVGTKSRKELIQDVLERLRVLLTQVVIPRKSLTICLDGPAPIAKIQTQRLRRRRVSLLDTAGAQQLTSLAITAGSLFMVELENALAAQLRVNSGRGYLRRSCPVFLYGTTVMGEGEAKISRALAFLASGGSAQQQRECAERFQLIYNAPYNPNDSVTVIGNDIDLVITCLGATFYHNISVVGPSSLQLIDVAEILYRWLKASSTTRGDSSRITPPQLPSVRVDFIFLFLLNGGDHYVGAGDVAMPLWKRYRTVRAAYPHSTLVSPNLDAIDVVFLADVLSAADYTGNADVQVGMDLLHAALWSLYTVVTGNCPDYHYAPPETTPNLSHLRAAAVHCQRTRKRIRLNFVEQSAPLTPLESFVALMPSEATLPKSVATTLRQPKHHALSRMLLSSNFPREVAQCAREAVEVSAPLLTTSEQYLRDFTSPVQLNALPLRKRLSRYEQHRMLATKGEIEVADPVPVVQRVSTPEYADYTHLSYPEHITTLSFECPFDRDNSGTHSLLETATTTLRYSGAAGRGGGGGGESSSAVTGNGGKARAHGDPRAARDTPRKPKRIIHLISAEGEAATPAALLHKTLEDTSHYTQLGRQLQPKALRQMKRRLSKLQQQEDKRVREAVGRVDRRYQLGKGDDAGFMDELQQFLGGDDSDDVTTLLRGGDEDEQGGGGRRRRSASRSTVKRAKAEPSSVGNGVREKPKNGNGSAQAHRGKRGRS